MPAAPRTIAAQANRPDNSNVRRESAPVADRAAVICGDHWFIPLDDAHGVLSVFGVGPSSREYQRWRRDDGFRQVDFEGILNESSAVLVVYWREWLQDAVEVIIHWSRMWK